MKLKYSLDDMRFFCVIAEYQSYKTAAEQLGVPLSTLSRRVAKLEQALQLRLFHRNAHRVTLTQTGRQYFAHFQPIFTDLEEASTVLDEQKQEAKGKIRIAAPLSFGSYLLAALFSEFLRRYDDIQIELKLSNSLIDIEATGMDLVFRVGSPGVDDWIVRHLREVHFVLCAAPEFPTSQLRHPRDLALHSVVLCEPLMNWELEHKTAKESYRFIPCSHNSRLEVDDLSVVEKAVEGGLGIGFIPDYYAQELIGSKRVKQVLPEWQSSSREAYMLYRDRSHLPLRVRLLADFMVDALSTK